MIDSPWLHAGAPRVRFTEHRVGGLGLEPVAVLQVGRGDRRDLRAIGRKRRDGERLEVHVEVAQLQRGRRVRRIEEVARLGDRAALANDEQRQRRRYRIDTVERRCVVGDARGEGQLGRGQEHVTLEAVAGRSEVREVERGGSVLRLEGLSLGRRQVEESGSADLDRPGQLQLGAERAERIQRLLLRVADAVSDGAQSDHQRDAQRKRCHDHERPHAAAEQLTSQVAQPRHVGTLPAKPPCLLAATSDHRTLDDFRMLAHAGMDARSHRRTTRAPEGESPMTVAGCSGAALPQAVSAGGGTAPTIDAAALAPIVEQLRALTTQLASLAQQLAAAGAGALGGGPTSGCSCSGGMQSMQGAQTLGSAQLSGGGANAAPTAAAPAAATVTTQTTQRPRSQRKAAREAADTSGGAPAVSGANFDIPKKNPYSFDEMVAKVKREVANPSRNWDHLCLGFAARAYGWNASGTETAIKQWQIMPSDMQHKGDTNPPPGALVFWDTGPGKAGHVAIYLGDGKIASNDIRRSGKIDIVPLEEISKKWGAKYLGWTPPYFENGV